MSATTKSYTRKNLADVEDSAIQSKTGERCQVERL